jgi:hypothetical protein
MWFAEKTRQAKRFRFGGFGFAFGFDFWLLIWLLRLWAFGRLRKQRIF